MDQSDLMFVRDVLDSAVTGSPAPDDVINALEMVEASIEDAQPDMIIEGEFVEVNTIAEVELVEEEDGTTTEV